MVDKCSTEHVFKVVYFFDDIGDVSLVFCFHHHNELTIIRLAVNLRARQLFDLIFYAREVLGSGMYHHTRNMNFLLIHRLFPISYFE